MMSKMLRALLVLGGVAMASLIATIAWGQTFTGTVQNHAIPIGKGPGVSGMTSLAPGAANTVVTSNGAAADPSYKTVTTILDAFCTTQGAILYRNATDWICLPPGQTGQPLMTGGTAANPAWGLAGSSGGVPYFSASGRLSGSATLTANRIVFGGGTATQPGTGLALGTTTQVLHGNAAGLPIWGAVDLTTDVTGTLPVSNGGTGATSLTSGRLLLANGTSPISVVASAGSSNFVLHGGGVPTWGQVELSNDVSGTLPVGSGGTGLSAYAQGDIIYTDSVSSFARLAKNTSATRYLSNTGGSNNPAWAQVALTTGASDYAESTFSPTLIGSSTPGAQTYTVQLGHAVRIGNSVTVHIRVTISAKDGAMAGNALIGNLPFTSRNVVNLLPSCSIGQMNNVTVTGGYFFWTAFVIQNSTTIALLENRSANTAGQIPVASLGAATDIIISCNYLIN